MATPSSSVILACNKLIGRDASTENTAFLRCKAGNADPVACQVEADAVHSRVLKMYGFFNFSSDEVSVEKASVDCPAQLKAYSLCLERTGDFDDCRKEQEQFERCTKLCYWSVERIEIKSIAEPLLGPHLRFSKADADRGFWTLSVLFAAKGETAPVAEQSDVVGLSWSEPTMIDQRHGWSFWRFILSIPLAPQEYQVNLAASVVGFRREFSVTLPALGSSPRIMFFSCNSLEMKKERPSLWHSVLEHHAREPFHLVVGGGDQIYNDGMFKQPLMNKWLQLSQGERIEPERWTQGLSDEIETFVFYNYLQTFLGGDEPELSRVLRSIPTVFMWDDHDVYDGFGSYPQLINRSAVMHGIAKHCSDMYYLFQQHAMQNIDMFGPGHSRHILHEFNALAVLALDARTERTMANVVTDASYQMIFERLYQLSPECKHVLVVIGVPLVYPKFQWVEKSLNFFAKRPHHFSIGGCLSTTILKPCLKTYKSPALHPEFLDDLRDQWRAVGHEAERVAFIERLQKFAVEKGVRVTFLTGDVHCAGVGVIRARQQRSVSTRGQDEVMQRYLRTLQDPTAIVQIISSPIGSRPLPEKMCKALVKKGEKPELLNGASEQFLDELISADVDSTQKKTLLSQRNWSSIVVGKEGRIQATFYCENKDAPLTVYRYLVPPPPTPAQVAGTAPLSAPTPVHKLPAVRPSSRGPHRGGSPHPLLGKLEAQRASTPTNHLPPGVLDPVQPVQPATAHIPTVSAFTERVVSSDAVEDQAPPVMRI